MAFSSARVDTVRSTVTLVSTGALSAASATAAGRYGVQVNCAALEIESAAGQGGNSIVVLGLPEAGIKAGDSLTVTYDVLDARRGSLRGTTTVKAK